MTTTRKRKQYRKKRHKRSKFKTFAVVSFLLAIIACSIHFSGLYTYADVIENRFPNSSVTTQVLTYDGELETPLFLTPRQEQTIRHTGYTVSYNKDLRLPNYVSYELTREETRGREKRSDRFIADPEVKGVIATNSDYARSGYDKGHMAPAADMKWSREAMKESFYFSNMCPQHPQLNRRSWKDLEEQIREWAVTDSALIVICGPITGKHPKTIGKNRVVVPEQFFKVVLAPYAKPVRAIAFLFDNRQATAPISTYVVSVDSIESLTGMDFFAPLPDDIEDQIEARSDLRQWN